MIKILSYDGISRDLEIVGDKGIIVRDSLIVALSYLGYLYANGQFYKLDVQTKLWRKVPYEGIEKEYWPLESDCRNLVKYVVESKGAPANVQLNDLDVRTIIKEFMSRYDLKWLAQEREKWINDAQKSLDDYYDKIGSVQDPKERAILELKKIDRSMYDIQDRIDTNDGIVAFRNGFIDIHKRYSMELIPHSEYLFIPDVIEINYRDIQQADELNESSNVIDYKCVELGKPYYEIYKETIPDEEALSVFARYCAIPLFKLPHIDRFLFAYGTKDSGKSCLRYAMSKLIGKRASPMTFKSMNEDRFGLMPFEYSDLVFIDDATPPKSQRDKESLGEAMKSLTNDGQIEIRCMRQGPKKIENHTQMFVISNHDNVFGGLTTSVLKRIIALPCNQIHDNPIPNLKEILEAEDSLNWLVNWLLGVYYNDLYGKSSGEIRNTLRCDYTDGARRKLYANAGDVIAKYIDEVLGLDPQDIHGVREYINSHFEVRKLEDSIFAWCDAYDFKCPDRQDIRDKICKEYSFRIGQRKYNGHNYNVSFILNIGGIN